MTRIAPTSPTTTRRASPTAHTLALPAPASAPAAWTSRPRPSGHRSRYARLQEGGGGGVAVAGFMLPRARRLQAHGFPPRHRTGVQRAYTRAELEAAGVAAAAAVTHQCRRPPCVGWGHARMPGRLPDSVRSHKHGLRPAVGPHAPPSCRCALLMLQPVCCYSPQLPTSCCSEARPGCSCSAYSGRIQRPHTAAGVLMFCARVPQTTVCAHGLRARVRRRAGRRRVWCAALSELCRGGGIRPPQPPPPPPRAGSRRA